MYRKVSHNVVKSQRNCVLVLVVIVLVGLLFYLQISSKVQMGHAQANMILEEAVQDNESSVNNLVLEILLGDNNTGNHLVLEDLVKNNRTRNDTTENNSVPEADLRKKVILFWGNFYNKNLNNRCIENAKSMDFCPRKCTYTTDKNQIKNADAVVVHGRERVKIQPPTFRNASQRWVFAIFESQDNSYDSPILYPDSNWNAPFVFNWTLSYRLDSDVAVPYGGLVQKDNLDFTFPTVEEISNKELVAWVASNCNRSTTSNRSKVVELLQNLGIPVAIYGGCGNYSCPGKDPNIDPCNSPEECYKVIGPKYKFYLSFENSLCEHYITEKFFNALKYGMVPVALGPSKEFYTRVAPPESFIHFEDFKNVKDLADYLLFLDKHPLIYQNFFKWKKHYEIRDEIYFRRSWCFLCEKLYTADDSQSETRLYESISDWWYNITGSRNFKGKNVLSSKHDVCKRLVFSNTTEDHTSYVLKNLQSVL